MKRITFVFFALCFLLFRPYQLHNTGMLYGNGTPGCDDNSYLAHALAIGEFEFPNYTRQAFVNGEIPMHSIGPGLLAAPFVGVANLVDRLQSTGTAEVRTYDSIRTKWAPFGFFVATVFYFWVACALLFDSAQRVMTERAASWSVILIVLLQGAALYAFRRPIFSHVYELLLQSAMVWLFVRWHAGAWRGPITLQGAMLLGTLAGLICLVRYNNVPLAAGWLLVFFWVGREEKKIAWRHGLIALAVILALITVFKLVPTLLLGREKYAIATESFIRPFDVSFIAGRLVQIFVGVDWGLVFTAPFLIVGLVFFGRSKDPIQKSLLWMLPMFAVNLYLVIMQGYQAAYYGYRLLIFSLMPLAVIPFGCFLDSLLAVRRRGVLCALAIVAILPTASMLFFEGNGTTLTLQVQRFEYPNYSFSDWDNKTYQLEVWKTLANPKEAAVVLAKGGPAFVAYAGATSFGKQDGLPQELQTRYAGAGSKLIAQTLAIWLLPWVLFWIWKRRWGPPEISAQA